MTDPAATSAGTPTTTATAPAAAGAQAASAPAPSAPAATAPPAQPGNVAAAAAASPAPLKLALPEGSPLSEAHLAKISEMAQKQGWSQEVAQEVLARQSDAVQSHLASLEDQHKASVTAWNQELTADKDIGGANLPANLDAGRRVLDRFGSPELVEALRASGYNAFPPLVKMLVKIGQAMAEDRIAAGAGGTDARSAAQRLYPSMPNP